MIVLTTMRVIINTHKRLVPRSVMEIVNVTANYYVASPLQTTPVGMPILPFVNSPKLLRRPSFVQEVVTIGHPTNVLTHSMFVTPYAVALSFLPRSFPLQIVLAF